MALRWLTTGGDRLRVRPPPGLPFTVVNGYGPTESTVFATWAEIAPAASGQPTPPIGRPLHNVTAYVLDAEEQRVPVGSAGELFLGGVQVARGYLRREELTTKAFLPDPFAKNPGSRMYRTGDWVRWLPEGELEFLGRRDGQIQVRGGRVELGEIEAVLFAHDGVRQACCVPLFDNEMPMGVVAHIVPKTPEIDLTKILRPYLAERLPAYMVPAQFVAHEFLPLTPQGKIDRGALQALPAAAMATTQLSIADNLDARLARLWNEMLPSAARARPHATFAELGGDSLLAMKLLLRVEELSARQIDFATFACNLGSDQPVYGIRSPALEDPRCLPQSIEHAATEAIPWIRSVQPQGAPALLGYSWGGLLGFEIARQLWTREGVNCFCAMLGTSAPPRPTSAVFRAWHCATAFPMWLVQLVSDWRNLSHRMLHLRNMAGNARQTLVDASVPTPDWARSPLSLHFLRLAAEYRPAALSPVEILLFREQDEYSRWPHPLAPWVTDHLSDGGWGRWTLAVVQVNWLKCNHQTILLPPYVEALANDLRSAMNRRDIPNNARR
jgi:thioesterase domain-containing protein